MPFSSLQITRRLLLAAAVLLGALAPGCDRADNAGSADHAEEGAEPEHAAVTVQTAPAERRAMEETVVGIGRSEALPKQFATLTPAVGGQIAAIRAALGDGVHRGDRIVELDTTIAAADLAEKEANRDMLQAALDLLTAEPRPEDRKGLEIAVASAKASVDRAEAALDRLRPLRARKEVSEAQFYETEQALIQSRLQQQTAEAQLNLLLAGPRPQAVAEAKARLAAAAQAVALSQETLKLHTICSAIDGVLDSLACHPGQTVAAGAAIGEVVDSRQLHVVVWLPAESAALVRPGQTARFESDSVLAGKDGGLVGKGAPRSEESAEAESAEAIGGKVVSVGQVVDPQTGNVPVRVLIENQSQRIAVGQTLIMTIVVGGQENELAVPTAAIIDLGEGPLLFVVRDGKAVQLHPAAINQRGPWTAISGVDLEAGEPVVIDGGYNLPDGAKVLMAPSKQASTAGSAR
jgi:RND family efflux transporter MFP subunit